MKIAGGRLYWPLERALHTDINYIMTALEGHQETLWAIFGKPKSDPTKPPGPPRGADGKVLKLTPAMFDAVFAKTAPEGRRRIRQKRRKPDG